MESINFVAGNIILDGSTLHRRAATPPDGYFANPPIDISHSMSDKISLNCATCRYLSSFYVFVIKLMTAIKLWKSRPDVLYIWEVPFKTNDTKRTRCAFWPFYLACVGDSYVVTWPSKYKNQWRQMSFLENVRNNLSIPVFFINLCSKIITKINLKSIHS